MKRPPGIWILLSAGVLWLSMQDVYGIRATALIFGKSTTTTTTPGPVPNVTDEINSEVVTETSSEGNSKNASKPALTGNPQIDYIHDPNLPQELNGYNLSEYPFYERVPDPDEIDFKCDGLHDGFYASIKFKCQVYHHCLFGTRFDFLCANYTAFDQKTFICQFVSDVDCVGSKKFWHRNDALYVAATTPKPLNIYTTAAPATPAQEKGVGAPRAGGKRRRPLLRRPQYEYYDDYADYEEDYYEDRPRSNRRRRPRPRPRPVYEDEYDAEYEDEAYEKRNRRPYNRRGSSGRRNKNRNKNRDISDDYVEKSNDRKKNEDDEDEDLRQNDRRKPSRDSVTDNERPNGKRKPQRYDDEDERPRKPTRADTLEQDKPSEKRKPLRDDDFDEDYEVERPSKKNTRPAMEDDYDDTPRNREYRPRKGNRDESDTKTQESKPVIVPTTGTIYDRPRLAPRIKPPVPKNEANKYAYKPIKATTPTTLDDEEYYDDYEEELPPKPSKGRKPQPDPITPKSSEIKERKQSPFSARNRGKVTFDEQPSTSRTKTVIDEGSSNSRSRTTLDEEDDAVTLSPKKSRGKDRYRSRLNTKYTEATQREEERRPNEENVKQSRTEKPNRNTPNNKKYPDPDYYDGEYEFEKSKEESQQSSSVTPKKKWKTTESSGTAKVSTRITTIKPTTSTEYRKERPEQFVRIVKRPFLPSRGGNPYVARGLQPVGFKAARQEADESRRNENVQEKSKPSYADEESQQTNTKPRYNPGSEPSGFEIRGNTKTNIETTVQGENSRKLAKPKFNEPISEDDDDFKPIKGPARPVYDGGSYGGPRTTQKPKVPDRNPLDISEQEYDVTLNDALNPTLPNLPVNSNFPVGFSPENDYTFSAFQRPRYVIEPVLNSGNDYQLYQPKQQVVRQQFETVPQSYSSRNEFLPNSNYYPQVVGNNAKRGIAQTQTQAYY